MSRAVLDKPEVLAAVRAAAAAFADLARTLEEAFPPEQVEQMQQLIEEAEEAEERRCEVCDKPLRQNPNELNHNFKKRRTCGMKCGNVLRSRTVQAKRAAIKLRPCAQCGEPMQPRKFPSGQLESHVAYAKRTTCSRRCAALYRNGSRSVPERRCKVCGEPLVRKRRPDGRLERMAQFKGRQTCGHECSGRMPKRRAAAVPTPARPPKPPPPSPEPARPPRVPQPPVNVPPAQAAQPAPRWRPPTKSEPVRMRPEGEVERCPTHGDVIGVYGCPACNAGEKWRQKQGTRFIMPGQGR